MGWRTALAAVATAAATVAAAAGGGVYSEHLKLQPLEHNLVLATFHFETQSDTVASDGPEQHFGFFPRSFGQIIAGTGAQELHLRFAHGWWDEAGWGALPDAGKYAGGTGVEVWAWMAGADVDEAEQRWLQLMQSLSGLFCASLNFVDAKISARDPISFEPEPAGAAAGGGAHLFHGALPSEPVCTENLTPFVKLLPCKGRTGVSSLLDGHKIFDAHWQGMSLDFVRVCDGGCRLEMTQEVSVVLSTERALAKKTSQIPNPVPATDLLCNTTKPYHSAWVCFPVHDREAVEWSLRDLFGKDISGRCALAADSPAVSVYVTDAWEVYANGQADMWTADGGQHFALGRDDFNLLFASQQASSVVPLTLPPVYAHRSMTGRGQERGGIHIALRNAAPAEPVRLVYFETLPWFMRPYLHTLAVHAIGGGRLDPETVITRMHYTPAVDRVRATHLELELTLPAGVDGVSLTYDFDKSLLYYTEYPPDANRGFDIAPGIVTVLGADRYTTRTTSLLLPLPTPDFSMPYNVIILTSTIMALAFGSIYNLLVRRFVTEAQAEAIAAANPGRLARVRALLRPGKAKRA
ncbi:GPI transamidase component PIG-T [Dipodascopsis tothii]|uniref:GPI transamidase component PIG-T n=1 Tax=Dipodascopsis tothii TaxID=44089 RepID=UPI0034CEEFD8